MFYGKGPNLKIGKDHQLANYLRKALKNGFRSPETALGEIEVKGMELGTKILPRTLYRYVDMGFIPGVSNMDLPHKKNERAERKRENPGPPAPLRARA